MNINTVEQARKLKSFKIWYKRQFDFVGGENRGWKPETFSGTTGYESSTGSNNFQGPALTLDELHAVFTSTCLLKFYPKAEVECSSEMNNIWRAGMKEFPRTFNHAEDWANILIWMIEEKHITANQVNEALK